MQIPYGYSESYESIKKRKIKSLHDTSEKLARRINHFFKNIDENYDLTKGQKNEIKNKP